MLEKRNDLGYFNKKINDMFVKMENCLKENQSTEDLVQKFRIFKKT